MYEDSWYSFVPEAHAKKDDALSQSLRHPRRESLLKQPNGNNPIPDAPDPIMDVFRESPPRGPPKATLARRAKSYSDFYDVALACIGSGTDNEASQGIFEIKEKRKGNVPFEIRHGKYEDDLIDASEEEYRLYREQLALSERHLDRLLEETASSLNILATLSGSFKGVESQTTAFQAHCEDLLAEQTRLRDLANEVGTDLQYYGYLEPLTRRLNAPGTGRLVRNDDFLEMLTNLNTCIYFMDQHPNYRDSAIYKTRYTSLLERSLNIVQIAFSTALREVSDDVTKQLRSKDQNETTEYVLFYGKYEAVIERLGPQLERLLTTEEFAFGRKGDDKNHDSYIQQWHELYKQLVESFIKCREPLGPLVLKNLRKFANNQPGPDTEFKLFSRRCVQYVFDICHNELKLSEKFFQGGPLMADYPVSASWNTYGVYSQKLVQSRMSHVTTLQTFLMPYLSNGDLHQVCDLVNWLETMYMAPLDGSDENDRPQQDHKSTTQVFLNDHLWPLSDALFIKAAKELEYFKPTPEDLQVTVIPAKAVADATNKVKARNESDAYEHTDDDAHIAAGPGVSTAYPTVKIVVKLLIMYNDSMYDRPKKGDVLYEIVHQATESLQRAATTIKRNSTVMDAQIFLIKNLMLIENLFMTHEIPDSIRQSAELDFSPIWDTIRELQARKQLFNPLAYINPLVKGHLLPAVVDHILDARKELEKVLVQQITSFTKYWQSRLAGKGQNMKDSSSVATAARELELLLNGVFEDETTKAALMKMIRAEESY